jgi:OOP family OmpA-OmpF porin
MIGSIIFEPLYYYYVESYVLINFKILDMKKRLQIISFLLITLLNLNNAIAQDSSSRVSSMPPLFSGNTSYRTWSFGLQAGAMVPYSAYGGKTAFSKGVPTLVYGGYVKYQASHAIGLQLDVISGTLEGNNEKNWGAITPISPYKSFKTDLHWAASLSSVITIGNINWAYLNTNFQPYVSIGVGFANYNPTLTNNDGSMIDYNPGGSLTNMYIPVGVGFKANLSKSINFDLGYTSSYMDVSNLEGYTKAPYFGSKFSYAHVGLEFSLGNSKKPQLATHNAPAQLYQKMVGNDNALRSLLSISEEKNIQRLSEINRLREEHSKFKLDADFDGVSDYFDKCPGTPNGVKVDGAGCALAVYTKDTVTKVYNNTTYIVSEEDRRIANDAVSNLEFEFGKSTIRAKSFPYLNKLAALLIDKNISLKLGGHTDSIGSDKANMNLSKDRAEALKKYLVEQGANGSKIEAVGYGENQPIASNKKESGRQKNRRVEFTLY